MLWMKKILLSFAMIFWIVLAFANFPVYGQDISEKNIRIGLFFDKTAKESYTIRSSSGFNILVKQNNENGEFKVIAEIDITELEVALQNGKVVFLKSGNPISNLSLEISPEKPVYISSKSGIIFFEGKQYRGNIGLFPDLSKKGMTAINELNLEEYLYGVIPLEMAPSWPMEALKAQAVAARTFAVYNINKWAKYGFDLTANSSDQVYGGYDCESPRTNQAVELTRGEIIYYKDKPVLAFFHSNSGGFTEDFKDWYTQELPYLKSKKDLFSEEVADVWEKNFSFEELGNYLKTMGFDPGDITDFIISERSSTGRVKKVIIKGTKGEKSFSSNEIRNLLSLKSTLFEVNKNITTERQIYAITGNGIFSLNGFDASDKVYIESKNGKNSLSDLLNIYIMGKDTINKLEAASGIKIIGRGWGHGIGMSQWGARVMAEKGYNYKDILSFYYTGVTIGR